MRDKRRADKSQQEELLSLVTRHPWKTLRAVAIVRIPKSVSALYLVARTHLRKNRAFLPADH